MSSSYPAYPASITASRVWGIRLASWRSYPVYAVCDISLFRLFRLLEARPGTVAAALGRSNRMSAHSSTQAITN